MSMSRCYQGGSHELESRRAAPFRSRGSHVHRLRSHASLANAFVQPGATIVRTFLSVISPCCYISRLLEVVVNSREKISAKDFARIVCENASERIRVTGGDFLKKTGNCDSLHLAERHEMRNAIFLRVLTKKYILYAIRLNDKIRRNFEMIS